MQPVPNYQIIEFLDWLKRNQRRIDIQSDELEHLAKSYLKDKNQIDDVFDLRFVLKIYQLCPQIDEGDIIGGMKHFSQCGRCIHYIFRRENDTIRYQSKVSLHPLLEQFLLFINDKDFQWSFISHERKSSDRIDNKKIDEIFSIWIRENGKELFLNFVRFIELTDKKIIDDFEKRKRYNSEFERDSEKDYKGELNISNRGLENEASRLVSSVKYILTDGDNLQNQQLLRLYSSVFKDDLSRTIEFFNWLIENFPKVNITSNIPSTKLNELIDKFCEDSSYSDISTFKKQVEKIFRGDLDDNLLYKVKKWFKGRGKQEAYSKNPFNRYNQMEFHGVFLFSNFGSTDLIKFIDESWQDLNSLTGDLIDIYYSKEDLRKRNGFDILKDFKSLNNIKLTDLPSFIIWDNVLKNALAIPLSDLNNKQILMSIQQIVQAIKDNKELKEVADTGMDFINEQLDRKIPKQIQYIMGDNFEFNNSQNFTFVNKSNVENSFNKVKEQFDEETASVIKQIAEIVEKSKKSEAVELFEAFNEEINKPEPKKTLLKAFWSGLSAILPVLSTTASIAEKVIKFIN